jgi:hypothetical protein
MLSLTQKFDTFLEEEGILEQCSEVAQQRIDNWLTQNWLSVKDPATETYILNRCLKIYRVSSSKERRLTALIDYCQTGDADYVIKGEGR